MAITIHKRATWAQYVTKEFEPGHAAADPRPMNDRAWSPTGGVFVHYLGPSNNDTYDTEEQCRREIARVYEKHWPDRKTYEDDIAYNFLVCPHGNVYEGRGYLRGSANGGEGEPVDGLGRNTYFYSICGLLRTNHVPSEQMLHGFRALIQHLRTDAIRPTGNRILPHSHGYDTACPGNLHMYAQQGSTIDPAAPWRGAGDIYVYEAQKWVNSNYQGIAPGYVPVREDGYTGWNTVYALTQALQHELGISPTVRNFGPGTFDAVKARNLLPGQETNPNIAAIFGCALWAKGYWAGVPVGVWNSGDAETALKQVYADAGLNYANRAMWPHVARALMRMDQFQQVPGGDPVIRGFQQRLNARYVQQVGIPAMSLVPCDGYYSRDVQQGFMMAIQYELGLSLSGINGYFGPGTQAALKGRGSQALTGDLRYLFRAACYVNSPVPPTPQYGESRRFLASDLETDARTSSYIAWLRHFQSFSQLPVTITNDYATWAQLLVSTGDAERSATGCDCITEITAVRAQALHAAGYRIVGRYLDEHIAPGEPGYLGKALKPTEPATILANGLRFFPIFQYNGTVLDNFTHDKGYAQGLKAHDKAVEHRIPAGATIYFAVDYDALDADITSNIKPYFEGVRTALSSRGGRYAYGVYGSRNVCTRISNEVGARWSLVSGMSWGFSGNLGFPLPANWSFNQIREYTFPAGFGLDHDVWRDNGDPGVSRLTTN